jgi:hypothetical protein
MSWLNWNRLSKLRLWCECGTAPPLHGRHQPALYVERQQRQFCMLKDSPKFGSQSTLRQTLAVMRTCHSGPPVIADRRFDSRAFHPMTFLNDIFAPNRRSWRTSRPR